MDNHIVPERYAAAKEVADDPDHSFHGNQNATSGARGKRRRTGEAGAQLQEGMKRPRCRFRSTVAELKLRAQMLLERMPSEEDVKAALEVAAPPQVEALREWATQLVADAAKVKAGQQTAPGRQVRASYADLTLKAEHGMTEEGRIVPALCDAYLGRTKPGKLRSWDAVEAELRKRRMPVPDPRGSNPSIGPGLKELRAALPVDDDGYLRGGWLSAPETEEEALHDDAVAGFDDIEGMEVESGTAGVGVAQAGQATATVPTQPRRSGRRKKKRRGDEGQ